MAKSRIPRTTVQGSVVAVFEMNDFVFVLVAFWAVFMLTRSILLGLITLFVGLYVIIQVDKLRFKVGPGYIYRKLYKLDLAPLKELPPYKLLWKN